MTAGVRLIAGREFRTYVLTVSFWLSLAMGPLLAAGAALLLPPPNTGGQASGLVLSQGANGGPQVGFSSTTSAADKAAMLRTLGEGSVVRVARSAPSAAREDPGLVPKLLLMTAVWAVVTASTGMCLHALARERAGRTLESLLALARPWEIVLGKLLGVAMVAAVVLAAWAAGGVALMRDSGWLGATTPTWDLPSIAAALRTAALVASALVFYGLLAIGVGGRARDIADAQNLSRPLFAVLLIAFFGSLVTALKGTDALGALVYAPPFTPFLLLLHPRGAPQETLAAVLMITACLGATVFATRSLRMGPASQAGWARSLILVAGGCRSAVDHFRFRGGVKNLNNP